MIKLNSFCFIIYVDDVKLALIIGNGDYELYDCNECKESYLQFSNLNVTKSLIELKKTLEDNDFIVMACIDLEATNFLRMIRLFREKCYQAKNVLAFVYIGGHGFHRGTDDYIVPSDIQALLHEDHDRLNDKFYFKQSLGLCSLTNLLENFVAEENETHKVTYLTCFWDLCRSTTIDFPGDAYSKRCKNLQYSIVYCWSVF